MIQKNVVETALEVDEETVARENAKKAGPIASLVESYTPDDDHLLGFVLDTSYDEATIVTCDAWKRKCGGVPKNSFVILKLTPAAARLTPEFAQKPALILGRVIQAAPTPLSADVQQTIFTIHKVQAVVDPYTNAELQWGALKVSILGTYYDDDSNECAFGNDVDSYMSPHFYEVYVPRSDDLAFLINSFVSRDNAKTIGWLRYTETRTTPEQGQVAINVSPRDFIANRTALFGKTRTGKSNAIKVIADMMLRSDEHVGQVIFDLNGEYANINTDDETSLFALHQEHCIRYSMRPHADPTGVAPPRALKVNFFGQPGLGHSIITSLFDEVHERRPPNYLLPLLDDWTPIDDESLPKIFSEEGDRQRHVRARSMYFAALSKAGFNHDLNFRVDMMLNAAIREELAHDEDLSKIAAPDRKSTDKKVMISDSQQLKVAVRVYERLFRLYKECHSDSKLFPPSKRTGDDYFNPIHLCLLRVIGDLSVSGAQYLIPFTSYHSVDGGDIVKDIVKEVDQGKTVIIDLANADEVVARFYSELIARTIFRSQTQKFTENRFGGHSVLFYFEEAHNLFRKDDRDLTSIYNRLAKEGAKNRIGMVYATQSMTTLSPDLLKNTENFFIAHLNDDREIRELTYRYEFRDVGLDVQRCKRQGYMRMITLSHRYALPVQIKKFSSEGS